MKNIFIILASFLTLSACVSNDTIQTVDIRDFDLNCDQLKYELTQLGVKFEEAEGDSGLTGKMLLWVFFSGLE